MTGPRSLGRLIRRHRHDADLTLEKLAEASGVSVRAISNLELGRSLGPQSATIDLIAASLGLDEHDREELLIAARSGRAGVSGPAPTVLAMPRGVTDFVGRASEVRSLVGLAGGERSGPAPVVVLSGTPGVGKTSFAVHAAGELAGAFPDGQLFLDLGGLDEHPPEPVMLLGRLINALAPDLPSLPREVGERAGLYRTLLLRRRILIVLDNAADEAQVRMLLPGDGPSMTVITSRRRLSGLETAHRLSLAPLARRFAVQMLTNLVGDQLAADDSSLDRLAELSGNLPLALRLIGHRLASHPGTSSARFAQRLDVEEHRLETLTAGDMRISAVFMTSYIQLSITARRLFRRLALIPAQDTGPAMAAVLADLPLQQTELIVDELVEFGLLEKPFNDRYRLHDLIRLFARRRLEGEESAADIAGTTARVEDWLLSMATAAGQRCDWSSTSVPADSDGLASMQTLAQAQHWLMSEADNWLAALRTAAQGRRYDAVSSLAQVMNRFSDHWSHWGHWTEVFSLASVAAEKLGDPGILATQLNNLAWALNVCDGDDAAAALTARRAYAAAEVAGDQRLKISARLIEAMAQFAVGDHDAALDAADHNAAFDAAFEAAQDAARLAQESGDRDALSRAMAMVGLGHEKLGRIGEALELRVQRLDFISDPATAPPPALAAVSALYARAAIGRLHNRKSDWDAAVQVLLPAVPLGEIVGIPRMQAETLADLGRALCETQRCDEGIEQLQGALAIYRRLNNDSEAERIQALLDQYSAG